MINTLQWRKFNTTLNGDVAWNDHIFRKPTYEIEINHLETLVNIVSIKENALQGAFQRAIQATGLMY